MTLGCGPVDADAGVVLRFAANAECAAQAIGAQGFQAMIGGPTVAGLLSALLTIFVAIIGYRLVLGNAPRLDEGIGRVLRLGLVLALITGWPAFQTLIYDAATQAPAEIAETILPAAGLPSDGLTDRVQQVYDAMRLGANGDPRSGGQQGVAASATQPPTGDAGLGGAVPPSGVGQPGLGALPQTASIFAVVTIGSLAAYHLAIGILLALAPLAILGLLFDGTLGLFNGWARALVGAALAGLGATVVTAVMLIPIEQEITRLQGWRGGGVLAVVDPQALPTLVLATAVAMLVTLLGTARMGSMLRYMPRAGGGANTWIRQANDTSVSIPMVTSTTSVSSQNVSLAGRDRAAATADALTMTVRREHRQTSEGPATGTGSRGAPASARQQDQYASVGGSGAVARRTAMRRSRAATTRDGVAR